jgi:hypothetical protein
MENTATIHIGQKEDRLAFAGAGIVGLAPASFATYQNIPSAFTIQKHGAASFCGFWPEI